jgi:hypothetical protein
VQKNFDAVKPRRSACFSCVNALRGEERNIRAGNKRKVSTAKKCLFYRHFSNAMNFVREFVQSAKAFAAPIRLRCMSARTEDEKGGSYTQYQVESLLFFSLCSNRDVVQVDSRLHCSVNSHPLKARRAAMAKKRKAKAPKKKKSRKKK